MKDIDKEKISSPEQEEEIKDEAAQTAAEETSTAASSEDSEKDDNQKESEEPTVEEQLEEAQDKIAELNDKYLRLMAEFDNYRKRVMKEKSELIKTAGSKVITTILPVLDDGTGRADHGKSRRCGSRERRPVADFRQVHETARF